MGCKTQPLHASPYQEDPYPCDKLLNANEARSLTAQPAQCEYSAFHYLNGLAKLTLLSAQEVQQQRRRPVRWRGSSWMRDSSGLRGKCVT